MEFQGRTHFIIAVVLILAATTKVSAGVKRTQPTPAVSASADTVSPGRHPLNTDDVTNNNNNDEEDYGNNNNVADEYHLRCRGGPVNFGGVGQQQASSYIRDRSALPLRLIGDCDPSHFPSSTLKRFVQGSSPHEGRPLVSLSYELGAPAAVAGHQQPLSARQMRCAAIDPMNRSHAPMLLERITFHLPSEHRFDGVQRPMEMQLHFGAPHDEQRLFVSVTVVAAPATAADITGGLLSSWALALQKLSPKGPGATGVSYGATALSITRLLPVNDRSYLSYTSPPVAEIVHSGKQQPCPGLVRWVVLTAPLPVADSIIAAFAAAIGGNASNARAPLALDQRVVHRYVDPTGIADAHALAQRGRVQHHRAPPRQPTAAPREQQQEGTRERRHLYFLVAVVSVFCIIMAILVWQRDAAVEEAAKEHDEVEHLKEESRLQQQQHEGSKKESLRPIIPSYGATGTRASPTARSQTSSSEGSTTATSSA